MANAGQLKALLKSHLEGDDDRFFSIAMQAAAHEARKGHGKLAEELRALIDEAKSRRAARAPVPISLLRGELVDLLEVSYPKARLQGMIFGKPLSEQLERIIREQRHAGRILEHGLSPRRKLLLVGAPGTGKTRTASVLAGELGLPLFRARLDCLVANDIKETTAKLRQIFDAVGGFRGIYFFDEFDAIGSQRGRANEIGERYGALNSFLRMIERDRSHSLIVAATNQPEIFDSASFRRFDDVLHYDLPTRPQIAALLRTRLAGSAVTRVRWTTLAGAAEGLNHAEVVRATNEALKDALIRRRGKIREADIRATLAERRALADRLHGREG